MPAVITEFQGEIAILKLNHGVTNPIGPNLVDELSASLAAVKVNARGMVLCGGSKFFSIGLDLPELLRLDRPAMSSFWEKFNHLCLDLYTAPFPTACALAGHAVAGGAILALTGDYRYAGSAQKQIGLNELKLGVPVPYLADMMLRQTIGDRAAAHMMVGAEFMSFSDAQAIGLIDEICSPETLEAVALEKLAVIAGYPKQAFSAIKANKVEAIRNRYQKHYQSRNAGFLDCWFSDPVQRTLNEAARKF